MTTAKLGDMAEAMGLTAGPLTQLTIDYGLTLLALKDVLKCVSDMAALDDERYGNVYCRIADDMVPAEVLELLDITL
jgi:hypothetical protein